eukprot:m.64287 g.64287  ORF g.64287 m.64287 type:complete len:61 (+) comp17861_c0_seq1:1629-1811(+)
MVCESVRLVDLACSLSERACGDGNVRVVMMDAYHTVDRSLSHLYPCHPDGVTDVGRGDDG